MRGNWRKSRWAFRGCLFFPVLSAGGWGVPSVICTAAGLSILLFLLCREETARQRALILPWAACLLGGIGIICCLQSVPLGGGLEMLSPRAAEVRSVTISSSGGPLSYEPYASLKGASHFFQLGGIVIIARALSLRLGLAFVLQSVVLAATLSAFVASIHQFLGLQLLYGFFAGRDGAPVGWTTFPNPNHAAGYMNLAATSTLALLWTEGNPAGRALLVLAFLGFAILSVSQGSTAGTGALIGLSLAVLLQLWLVRGGHSRHVRWCLFAVGGLAIPAVAVWIVLHPGIFHDKLYGIEAAFEAASEHAWLGVGRGSFRSVYTLYQESNYQPVFAFPENIFAQYIVEFGWGLGLLFMACLLWGLMRRTLNNREPHRATTVIGLWALLAQNLVDFSLEIPAVALAFAALFSALGRRSDREVMPSVGLAGSWRLSAGFAAMMVVPAVLAATGDLDVDINRARSAGPDEAGEVVRRHPASSALWLELAKGSEDRVFSLLAAQNALYLAPRQSAGYIAAAYALVAVGRRSQALGVLQDGWRATNGESQVLKHLVRIGAGPAEWLRGLPVADPLSGRPTVESLARLARFVARSDVLLGARLLDAVPPLEVVELEALDDLLRAAVATGRGEIAQRVGERLDAAGRIDEKLELELARLLTHEGQARDALELLGRIEGLVGQAADSRRRLLLRNLMLLEAWDEARSVAEQLPQSTQTERCDRLMLLADIEWSSGHRNEALTLVKEAIRSSPGRLDTRVVLARWLVDMGRKAEAERALEAVIRRDPAHDGARRMLEELRRGEPAH